MDLKRVMEQLLGKFGEEGIDCASIGGFALAALGIPRATVDLDFQVPGQRAEQISQIMREQRTQR